MSNRSVEAPFVPLSGRRRRSGLLAAAVLSAVAAMVLHLGGVLAQIEGWAVDVRYQTRAAESPPGLLVVDVDDETFRRLERTWPFPRSLHGRVAERLHAAGARAIVFDVQFTEPTEPDEDLALYDALGRAGGAVLATTEFDADGRHEVLGGPENLAAIDSVAAAADLPYDTGGVIRRVPVTYFGQETLAAATARRAGRPVSASIVEPSGAWIDYAGPAGTVPTVSYASVLRGQVDPALVRDAIVVIGSSSPSLQDVHSTPFGTELMSGPELQANAIRTLLDGVRLRSAPPAAALLVIILVASALPLAALKLRVGPVLLLAPVLGAANLALAQVAFLAGIVLPVVAPAIALAASTFATVIAGYLLAARERRRVAAYSALLEEQVRVRTAELRATQLEVVHRLGQAVDFRDEETGGHIRRMSALAHRLAVAAGVDPEQAEMLRHAAALHDVGKIGVPDEILRKPGRLDQRQWEEMKRHTLIGADVLAGSASPLVRMAEQVARSHHERWDGSGYPLGLTGDDIPLVGRICAIADVFDALTSARPYKRAWSVAEARAEIAAQGGRQFDPDLVDVFLSLPEDVLPVAAEDATEDGIAVEFTADLGAEVPAGASLVASAKPRRPEDGPVDADGGKTARSRPG